MSTHDAEVEQPNYQGTQSLIDSADHILDLDNKHEVWSASQLGIFNRRVLDTLMQWHPTHVISSLMGMGTSIGDTILIKKEHDT